MNRINFTAGAALIIALLIFLQGLSILRDAAKEKKLRQKEIRKRIGSLTILLAVLGMVINILFLSTDTAISPEFGVFIIHGNWPRAFFAFCGLGLILCVALGWDLARLRENCVPWGGRLYLWGLLVWALCCSIILPKINTPGVNETPIYLYDIWWPPLLIWLTVGFTDIVLTILRVQDEVVRGLAAIAMVMLLILAASAESPLPDFAHPWTRMLWVAAAILLLIPIWIEVAKPARTLKAKGQTPDQFVIVSHLQQNIRKSFHIDRRQAYTLGSLVLIFSGMVVLLTSSSLTGPAPGIILALIGWGCMTEILTDGWFHHLYGEYKSGEWFAAGGSIDQATVTVRNGITNTGARLGKIFSLPTHWTAIIKLLILVILLVALNETQNRGKTIIQPFQAVGFADTPALMNSADDRLINDLSILNQQLQPIIIFPTSSGIVKKRVDYVQAGNLSSFEAALNNSGEFELGGVKIPANVLVSPVQGLVRPWLKVRMVNGSLISNRNGYVLLVNASDGGTWISQPVITPGLNPQQELGQELPDLVEQMAFLMLSSEESLQNYGLTRDWEAFRSFRSGVENIQSYQSKHDYDALTAAIQDFRRATLEDPNFALAYYRLGLALQQNRQPWQAEDALRIGLALSPESVPLKNALAYHLYFFDSYAPLYPSILHASEKLTDNMKRDKKSQARRLWHQIVNLPNSQVLPADRASAYLGLCNAALDGGERYIAYFDCIKSHTLLERLPPDQQSLDKIRQADASALNNLGVIIYGKGFSKKRTMEGWFCAGEAQNELPYDPAYADYAEAALGYYQKALDVQPQDSVIQCNAAIVALLLDRSQRMRELEQSAQAHYVLGSKYLDQAKKEPKDATQPSPYYKQALIEYKKAIDLNPTYHEALNGFAHTYWVFRLRWTGESPDTLGIEHLDSLVQYYADKALRLAKMQNNDYLEVLYGSTKAEVSIANGDFKNARAILLEHEIPESYVFDEVRWNFAQNSLCLLEEGTGGVDNAQLKTEAGANLRLIQTHENLLETYVFSYTSKEYLTDYRLPCRQFASSQR
jgi:tetratricopeptide (TPR) repeat protein